VTAGTRGRAPARAALTLLGVYQRWVGSWLPPACRYWPTCSEYARLAIARHGVLRGSVAAAWRLARCQPLFRGGIDPPR
jgi:putative membrane protein insertion efficiency factor